jgi:hypothetical protein
VGRHANFNTFRSQSAQKGKVLGEISLQRQDANLHDPATFCFPLQDSISIAKTEVRCKSASVIGL